MKSKTTKAGIILCILLIGSILPVVSGKTDITTNQNMCDSEVVDSYVATPVFRFFLIGRIRNLDVNYGYNSSNYTIFTAVRVLEIRMYRYEPLSRSLGVTSHRNAPISFSNEYFQFRGILRNRFICGVFKYVYEV